MHARLLLPALGIALLAGCASAPKPLEVPLPESQKANDVTVVDEIQRIDAEIARADEQRRHELEDVATRLARARSAQDPTAGHTEGSAAFSAETDRIIARAEAEQRRIEESHAATVASLQRRRAQRLPAVEPTGSGQATLSSSSVKTYAARCKGCQQVEVFFATDRRTGPHPQYFTGERGDKLRYGRTLVSIPANHKPGEVESPATFFSVELAADPTKHIVMDTPRHMKRDAFYDLLRQRTVPSKKILLFIHGYNCTFPDAVRRLAQLEFDLPNAGIPVLYSWPSAGKLKAYPYDKESTDVSKSRLATFLREIAEQSGATSLQIVAHSMGNLVLAKAIDELRAAGYTLKPKVQHLVLAAPDLTVDYFKQIATAFASNAQHVTLYASAKDRALTASKEFQNSPRAGEKADPALVTRGIDMVDVTDLNEDFFALGHSYVFSVLLADLAKVFNDVGPDGRYLLPVGQPPSRFWRARPLR